MEESADICKFWTHDNFLAIGVLTLILLDELGKILINWNHYVVIGVILHDFKDLNLMCSEAPSIAVDEVPEEIKQFAFIEA